MLAADNVAPLPAWSDLPPADGEQARKVLVLYDQEAKCFFLSSWPMWRRVSKLGGEASFDCDDNNQVRMLALGCSATPYTHSAHV